MKLSPLVSLTDSVWSFVWCFTIISLSFLLVFLSGGCKSKPSNIPSLEQMSDCRLHRTHKTCGEVVLLVSSSSEVDGSRTNSSESAYISVTRGEPHAQKLRPLRKSMNQWYMKVDWVEIYAHFGSWTRVCMLPKQQGSSNLWSWSSFFLPLTISPCFCSFFGGI